MFILCMNDHDGEKAYRQDAYALHELIDMISLWSSNKIYLVKSHHMSNENISIVKPS